MLLGSERRSSQDRLRRPSGCVAIQGRNWSDVPVSSDTLTGADQVVPPSREEESLTSASVQAGLSKAVKKTPDPQGKMPHAQYKVPAAPTRAPGLGDPV